MAMRMLLLSGATLVVALTTAPVVEGQASRAQTAAPAAKATDTTSGFDIEKSFSEMEDDITLRIPPRRGCTTRPSGDAGSTR